MIQPIVELPDIDVYMLTLDSLPDIKVYTAAFDLISEIHAKHFLKDIDVGILTPPSCTIYSTEKSGCWAKLNTLTDELHAHMMRGYFRLPILSINGTIYKEGWGCLPNEIDFDFQFKQVSHEFLEPEYLDKVRAFAKEYDWTIR